MSMPVVVTRMQNRRGTQDQFEALYPPGYTLPPYNGIGGFSSADFPDYNIINYPEVLLSGELALCTDSRRTFLGNINGEYIELQVIGANGFLNPISISLPPASAFTVIPQLTYDTTPFISIDYSITDSTNPDWNVVGTNYSANGVFLITAVAPFTPVTPVAPFPAVTPVTLTNTSTEINKVLPNAISFIAQYNVATTQIEISYMHNFTGPLLFNTSSIKWAPF